MQAGDDIANGKLDQDRVKASTALNQGAARVATADMLAELQALAMDRSIDIADLLRKGLYVASRLENEAFKKWAQSELSGYPSGEVPDYRHLRSSSYCMNPYQGLVPFDIQNEAAREKLQTVPMNQPIGELVTLASGSGELVVHYDQATASELMRHMKPISLTPVRRITSHQIAGVIDVVRTRVLNFALEMDASNPNAMHLTKAPVPLSPPVPAVIHKVETFNNYTIGNIANSNVLQGGAENAQTNVMSHSSDLLNEAQAAIDHLNSLTSLPSDQRQQAIAKLAALRQLAADPYGATREKRSLARGAVSYLNSVSSSWVANHIPTLTALAAPGGWFTRLWEAIRAMF